MSPLIQQGFKYIRCRITNFYQMIISHLFTLRNTIGGILFCFHILSIQGPFIGDKCQTQDQKHALLEILVQSWPAWNLLNTWNTCSKLARLKYLDEKGSWMVVQSFTKISWFIDFQTLKYLDKKILRNRATIVITLFIYSLSLRKAQSNDCKLRLYCF